jgi:hypothetical protein
MPKKIKKIHDVYQKVERLQESLEGLLNFLNEYPHQFNVDISGYLDDAYEALKETGYKIPHVRGTPWCELELRGERKKLQPK